jgi:hypothetical protein
MTATRAPAVLVKAALLLAPPSCAALPPNTLLEVACTAPVCGPFVADGARVEVELDEGTMRAGADDDEGDVVAAGVAAGSTLLVAAAAAAGRAPVDWPK